VDWSLATGTGMDVFAVSHRSWEEVIQRVEVVTL
jgi:hypothetical protein